MQVKIYPAKRPRAVVLAEDHGYLAVESNAVPQLRTSAIISLDGFVQQRNERAVKLVRGLAELGGGVIEALRATGMRDL